MLESLIHITREASRIILDIYERSEGFEITQKEDRTPVTEADLAGHHHIIAALKELAPEIPVISEESGVPLFEERTAWERFFLVDPLDGTKEFISRNGEFTVNIALIEAGVPVLGVVGVPVTGAIYVGCGNAEYGEVGSYREVGTSLDSSVGATSTVNSASRERLISRRFAPPGVADVVVSRSHGDKRTEEFLKGIGIQTGKSIASGSSLKFCRVAEGVADLYPRMGPTMEWDTAAGDAVWRWSVDTVLTNEGKSEPSEDPLIPRWSPITYNKSTLKNEAFILGLEERDHPVQITL